MIMTLDQVPLILSDRTSQKLPALAEAAGYVFLGIGAFSLLMGSSALAQKYDGSGAPALVPHTLREALSTAYLTNPTLREARARLRATDEQLSAAMAGWRPTITASASVSHSESSSCSKQTYSGLDPHTGKVSSQTVSSCSGGSNGDNSSKSYTTGVSISQPIFQGGRTINTIHMSQNQIMAQRASLFATEQQILLSAVSAYVSVVEDEQLLQISLNNEHVLQQQLDAANKRFRLGELSRTDVAQAQGALASATSARQQAEGTLETAQASYQQIIGIPAAPNLLPPQPLVLPVHSEQEAINAGIHNNPNVINALFSESEQKNNISVQMATIMPQLAAMASYQHGRGWGGGRSEQDNKMAGLTLQVPIYQGGREYAAVRQARQLANAAHHEVDAQRRQALQLASSSWQQYQASRESIKSNRLAVSANIAALAGVERQALLGTSTTLAVLQQQQTLLQSQQMLIQNIATMVNQSYAVAAAIGRLTAVDLKLSVPLYDETAYYRAVKTRLWGISDVATDQPGR